MTQDCKSAIQETLEPDPLGKTEDELYDALDYAPDEIDTALSELERDGCVKQIGEQWRWVDL